MQWGFRIDQPPGWSASTSFPVDYLANGAWKAYAGPDSRGSPVVAMRVPGSDRVSDAEIRIGASRDPAAVADCLEPPQGAVRGAVGHRRIGGVDFTTFTAADAAMSHRLEVHAYRTVHDGACYAIDLLVHGTDPRVYDPPATPPFTDAEAFDRMQDVLASFRFTR